MALSTTAHPTTTQQAPMAPQVQTPTTEGAKPVLFDDLDPILLARLYPDALKGGMADARGLALKAGEETHTLGTKLMAAAQEPIAESEGVPMTARPAGPPVVGGAHGPLPPQPHAGPPAPH